MNDRDREAILARWARLESTVDSLQSRIKLEENSLNSKFTKWGTWTALVISILVGAFTVYEQVLVGPEERRQADLERLNEIVEKITEANLKALAASQSASDTNATWGAMAQTMNSIKIPLLASAEDIIERYPESIDTGTLLVIVSELQQKHDFQTAIRFSHLAVENADIEDLRIEAVRMLAVSNMGTKVSEDLLLARALFQDVIEDANQLGTINGAWAAANAIRDWTLSEITVPDCKRALEAFKKFFTSVSRPLGTAAIEMSSQITVFRIRQLRICPEGGFVRIANLAGK